MTLSELFILLSSVSLDTFFAGMSYGIEKIKISFKNLFITSCSSTIILLFSIFCGSILASFIDVSATKKGSMYLLLFIGIWKLLSYLKRKITNNKRNWKWKLGCIELMISIQEDPKKADLDCSKNLSLKETLLLSVALSIDNFGIGLGLGMLQVSIIQLSILSLITNCFLLFIGYIIGKCISKKINIDLSWISGILLIFLALKK